MAEPAADPTVQIAQLTAENEALKKRLEVSKLKDEDIKDLEELVAELERETARETKRANIATSSLNAKTRDFKVIEDELRGEIDRLEGELQDARAELEVPRPGPEHLATIDELKGQVQQLEKQVSEQKSRADSLEQKLSAAVSQAAEEKRRLEDRLSEEQRKVIQLEDEKRRAIEEGQMQVKAVKAVATKTEIKKNELQAEVNNLTTQVKVLSEEKARYIEKENNWNRARSELEELVTNLSQASKNLDVANAERTATLSRKQELEANLRLAEAREQDWIRQRAEMEINIKAQAAKEQSWIIQRSELEANIRVFQEKEKMWQQQKEQLDGQIRDLHAREQAWMDKRIELESGVKALSVTTQSYDQTRSELDRVTRSFTMNETQWNQQRQEYEANLKRSNDERAQIQENLNRLTQERDELKQSQQTIQRDLEEMKAAYAKLYEASTQLTQQLAAYQEKEMAWLKEKTLLQASGDDSKLGPLLKEKEAEWQQAVQSLQDELVRARLTETQTQALIAEESKKQGALQKQLVEEGKRTEAAQVQVRALQGQVKQLQQEIDKAQQQLASVTADKDRLDAALAAKTDEFNKLAPQQQADTQLLRMAVEEEKKAGALRVQALDAKLQASQKEVERLSQAASEAQLKITQQKVELDRLNSEFDRLTKSLNTERDDRIRKETELSSLKSAIAAGAAGSGGSLGQWQAERAKLEAEMVLVKQAGARTAAQMVAEERKQTSLKEQGWLKERAELEKGLTALSGQVSDLQQQLGNATEELRMAQDTLDAERKAAVEHAELWQDEKKQLEEGMVTLHSSVQEWEKAFNEAIAAATSNQEQYANQIRAISDDRKRVQQRLDQLQKERDEVDKKLLNSNAERAKFEAQTLRLMAELEDLKSRSPAPRTPVPASPVSPSMQAKLESLVQEKNQLTTVVADLTRTLNEKERLLAESSQRVESLQQTLRDTTSLSADAASGAEASQLRLKVIELQDELQRVNSTFSAAMADKDSWETQRKAYEANITSLQQHITQLTTTAKQLQGNQVQLQAFVSTLQKQIADSQKERETLSQKMLEAEMESKRAVAALKRDLYSQLQDASNRSLELANALAEERKAHQAQLKGGAVSQIVDAERQSFQVASNNWQKERDAFQQTIAQQQARLATLEAAEGIWRQEQLRLEDKISRLTSEMTLQKQDIKGLERDLKHTMMQSQASLDMRAESEAKWEAEREQMRKYVIGLKIGWVFKDKLRAKVKATLLAQMQQLAERCSQISNTLAQERKETAEVLSQWRERELEWLSQREQLLSVINMAKTSHGQAGQFIEKAQTEWMDEKATLENQLAQFQDVLAQYQEQVTAHQASVQEIVNGLAAELDQHKQANEELQAKLNASEEERTRIKTEYDRIRLGYQKDMAAAKMDLYVKLQAVATKSASLSQALADERKQSADVVKGWLAKEQDWLKQRADAEAAMGEKKATILALEQKVGEVLSENMVYHERLAQMEQIVRQESAKGGDLSSKLNAQFSEFREKQQGFAQLRTDLEDRLFDTREALNKLTEQHEELKALHARNTTALAETTAKLTTVSEQLQVERARNKSNEDTFREQLRSHEANVFGLEQAVRRLGAELNVPKLVSEHTELTILVKQLTEEREETIARQFAENLMMSAERSDRQNTQEMLESRLHGVLAESAAKDKEIARLRVLATDSLNELTEESGRATVARIRLFEEKARIDLVEEEFEDTVNHLVRTYEDRISEMEQRNEEDRRFKATQLQELVDEFNTREDQLLNEIEQLENDLEEAHALIGGGAHEGKSSTESDNDELRVQIATLSEQLQLANQEISDLMDNLDDAERELQEEIGRNAAMRFEVAAANRARRDAQEELADTALTMEKYYRDVTESLVTKLQTQRADAEAKYAEKSQQAADEIALLTETVESLETQLDTAQVELDHLWQEKRDADARVEGLEDTVADLHDEKHTQAELTHLMQEQQSLFSIVGGPGVSSVKVVELVTQLDVMRGENKQLKLAINEMHKEFQETMAKSLSDVEIVGMALAESMLSKQQERYNKLLEQQQEMYETNEKKIASEADRAQAAADSQIATLRSAIEEQVIVITELRNKIDSLKDNVTAREKETLEHEEELLRMEDQIAELAFLADNARAEDLTTHAELEEERRRGEMLNEEILRLQETESQLREQVTRQAAELNKLQFVNRVLQEQNSSFTSSIQKQIAMTESTKSELRNIKHTAREAVIQVEELTAKLQVLHKQNSELSSRIDGTHREVDAIRDTIARLTATGENSEGGGEEKAAKSFFTFRSPSKKNLSKEEVRDGKVKIPKDPKAMQELLQGVLDLLRTQQQDLEIWEKKYPDMESEVTEARYQIKRTVQEQNALRELLGDTENRLHELQETYAKDKASELEALTLFQHNQAQIQPVAAKNSRRK